MDLKKIDLDKLQDYAFTADEIAIRKAAISNSKFINIKCLDNESLIPTVKAIPIAKIEQAREEVDRYFAKFPSPKWAKTTLVDIKDVYRILDNLIESVESINDNKQDNTSMFVEIEHTDTWTVVYHKETKVMYAVSSSGDNYGNFTLLVNADGSPMLWEE